jgi:hypothetical protein
MPQWTSHAYCTLQWINHQVSLTPVMRHWLLCEKTTFSYGERWCLCSLVFLSLTNLSFHHLQRLEMLAPRESVLNVFITSNDTHYQTQRGKWVESFQNPNYKFSKWPNRKFKKPPKDNPDIRFHSLMFGNRWWYELSAHSLTDLCSVWMCLTPVNWLWFVASRSRLFHGQGRPFCWLHLWQTSMGQREDIKSAMSLPLFVA